MGIVREDPSCYASQAQRNLLTQLVTHPVIENHCFLTGGTALSAFYLYHRVSNDLDLFTREPIDLGEIDFWIKTRWPEKSAKIREGPQFLSLLVNNVKVDFVIDPLSLEEDREMVTFENQHHLTVDTIRNIITNKFCALVSRTEPKDFIDFYVALKTFSHFELQEIYRIAKSKDAIFDDPPTAAFQLESGIAFFRENPSIVPQTLKPINLDDLFVFHSDIARWLYSLLKL